MSTFAYAPFDSKGKLFRGDIEGTSWTQALRRGKEMGLFPASVRERARPLFRQKVKRRQASGRGSTAKVLPFGGRVAAAAIVVGLTTFVITRFKVALADVPGRSQLPAFTEFVLNSYE